MQLRPSTKFFETPLPRSVLEWHKGWLYASGLGGDSSPIINEPLKRLGSWKPVDKPSEISKRLIDTVSNLKDRGLERVHILRTWLERRVLLPTTRASSMYSYTGPGDSTRVIAEELSEDEVRAHIHALTDLMLDTIPFDVVLEPFCMRPPFF